MPDSGLQQKAGQTGGPYELAIHPTRASYTFWVMTVNSPGAATVPDWPTWPLVSIPRIVSSPESGLLMYTGLPD